MTDAVGSSPRSNLLELSSDIVSAYVSHNAFSPTDLPMLIATVYSALNGLGAPPAPAEAEVPKPAVNVRRSVTPDHIVCLECGKTFKSMKRHLTANHEMTPRQYRERWSLPADYPMVAPNYSETRSSMAKKIGLGRKPPASRRRKRVAK